MIITRYICSMLNVDHVQLPAGEELTTPDSSANAEVYGVYVLSGEYVISAADDPQHVGSTFAPTGNLVPNDVTCGATVRALADTSWLCFSQNDETQRGFVQMDVDRAAVLPAGFGFFVIEGTVQADGKTANQFQFFKPRAADVTVTGSGALLLVR
jgi:hypothetical protein